MSQISKRPLNKKVSEKVTHIFLETIVRIREERVARSVLEDMLTPNERIMISKRLAIVYLLEKGYDYRTISNVLNVSLTTISRMSLIRQSRNKGLREIMQSFLNQDQIKHFFDQLDLTISTILPPDKRQRRSRLKI